jgi:dTDP-4-dehydrorhamnose 3,5-epimerase
VVSFTVIQAGFIDELRERVGIVEDVIVIPLKKAVNLRGHLLEVQRVDDSHYPGFGQAYVTVTRPGVVKAWYRHSVQLDQITLLTGALHLVLYDAREGSGSCHKLQHIYLGESSPVLVQIPPGIWHGFQAISSDSAMLLHLNTSPFDFNAPDEERLAEDDPSIPYCWRS